MMIGEPPKQIFGKSWEFGPRRGGVWPNPNSYKSLFLRHIWPYFAENFRQIHGKNPNVRGGGGQAGWAKFPTFTENLFWKLP